MATKPQRYDLGIATLAAITGGTGGAVVESLKDIAPDLAEWIISFSYARRYVASRPGYAFAPNSLRLLRLPPCGTAAPQLKVHIHGALNVGCQPAEVVEVILQMVSVRRLSGCHQCTHCRP